MSLDVETELTFVCQSCNHQIVDSLKKIKKCPKCGSDHFYTIARPVVRHG